MNQRSPTKRIQFLDCPVDNLSMSEVIAQIEEFIRSGEPRHVVAINANKLWRMARNPRLDRIVRSASLIVPEKAVVMGSRVLGSPLKDHIGGIMLLQALLPVAAERGYRPYFIGARPQVVERMVENLRRDYPELRIAGWHHGYLDKNDEARVIHEIQATRTDMLFVAMGTPKQEYWIADHLHDLGVPMCMGVGGSFDVLSGLKNDAPAWVRALAMEWLYRLIQDPGRLWKRYLITIPWFWYKVLTARIRQQELSLETESRRNEDLDRVG